MPQPHPLLLRLTNQPGGTDNLIVGKASRLTSSAQHPRSRVILTFMLSIKLAGLLLISFYR